MLGDSLTGTATVTAIREDDDGNGKVVDLDVSTKNADGVEVVKGSATARVD